MRVAETRAVNRALRKAYGIGLCSVEELGSFSAPQKPVAATSPSNGHARIERLKQWPAQTAGQALPADSKIRTRSQPGETLCSRFLWHGTLRDAGRDLVEAFVSTVAEEAAKDRAALLCKLNSYSQPEEVKS